MSPQGSFVAFVVYYNPLAYDLWSEINGHCPTMCPNNGGACIVVLTTVLLACIVEKVLLLTFTARQDQALLPLALPPSLGTL